MTIHTTEQATQQSAAASAVESRTGPAVRADHVGWAMLALAVGGFAIGTTEFVTMGVLPQLADGVDVSLTHRDIAREERLP